MTSSPGRTPTASRARCKAVVPLDTAHACAAPTNPANSRSNAATSGPCVIHPDRMARCAAETSSWPSRGRATGTKSLGSMGRKSLHLPIALNFLFQEFLWRLALAGVPVAQAYKSVPQRDCGLESQKFIGFRAVGEESDDIPRTAWGVVDFC